MEEHNLDRILEQLRECDTTRPYIFISYTSANKYEAWRDALELQRRGYNVWLDDKNVDKTKKDWRDDCIEAIRNMYCAIVLFYLCEYSITSKNCLEEMRAIDDDITKKRHNGKPVPFCPIDVDPISSFDEFTDFVYNKIYYDSPHLSPSERNKRAEVLSDMRKIFFSTGNDRLRIKSILAPDRHPPYYDDIVAQLKKKKIKPLYPPQPKKDEKEPAGGAPAKTAQKTPKEPQAAAATGQKTNTKRESAGPTPTRPHASGQQRSSAGRDPDPESFAESLRMTSLPTPASPAKSEQDEAKEAAFPLINKTEETSEDLSPAILIEGGEDIPTHKSGRSTKKDSASARRTSSDDPEEIAKKYEELSRQYDWNNRGRPESKPDKDGTKTISPSVSYPRPRSEDVTPGKPEPVPQPDTATVKTNSPTVRGTQPPEERVHYYPYEDYADGVSGPDDYPDLPKRRKRRKSISRWAVFLQLFAVAAAVTVFVVTNAVSLIPLDLISPISFSATSAFFVFLAFYVFSAISTGLTVVNIKQYSHTPKVKNRVGFLSCILLMAGITTVAMICGKAAFKEASGTAARFAITPFLFWLTNVIYLSFSDDLSKKCTKRFMIFGALRNFITVVLFFFLLQTDIPHFWVAVLLAVPSLLLIWGSTKTEMDNSDTYFTGIPLLLFWLMFRIACYVLLGEHDGFWMNLLAALGYNLPTFLISLLCIFLSTSI